MNILGSQSSSGGRVAPSAPTIGTATDVGTGRAYNDGAATVTFTPAANQKYPATSYTVTSSPGGFTASGASSPITVTGLASATSYTFTVTATNQYGTSSASSATGSITATTVPQAPTIGSATGGNASATVTYTANATGGKAVSTYTATSSPGSLTGTGSSPITVSGLTNGTAYTFTVTATNANGTSAASAASNSVTPALPKYYVMVGDTAGIMYSSDVASWTNASNPSAGNEWWCTTANAGTYWIAGTTGIWSSTNFTSWTQRLNPGATVSGDMRYLGNLYIATGQSKMLYTSSDGITWTNRTPFGGTQETRGIAYNGSRWGVSSAWDSNIGANWAYSSNGTSWTAMNIWTAGTQMFKCDANSSVFAVPAGSGDLLKSADGSTSWSGVSAGFTGTGGIAWGNNTWVQVGSGGQTSYSTSATAAGGTFTTNAVGSSAFYFIKFLNGMFIAGGAAIPTFYTSTNGVTWTTRTGSLTGAGPYRNASYG